MFDVFGQCCPTLRPVSLVPTYMPVSSLSNLQWSSYQEHGHVWNSHTASYRLTWKYVGSYIWGHVCHVWTIWTMSRTVTPTDDPLTTFQCYIRWIKAVIPLELRAVGRNKVFSVKKGVKWAKIAKNCHIGTVLPNFGQCECNEQWIIPKGTTLNSSSFGEAILLPQRDFFARKRPKKAQKWPETWEKGPRRPGFG